MNISNILIYWFLCLIYKLQYKNKQILWGRRNFYWILLPTTYLPKSDFAGVNATCNDKDLSQAKCDLTTSTFIGNTFFKSKKNSVDPLYHGTVSIYFWKSISLKEHILTLWFFNIPHKPNFLPKWICLFIRYVLSNILTKLHFNNLPLLIGYVWYHAT